MTPAPLGLGLAGLIGLCLGSFSTTAALRSCQGEQVVRGRSRCDGCGVSLSYVETAPVVGYWISKGACRGCGARINPLHPIGEVCGGFIGVAAFGLAPPLAAIPISALGLVLLASAVVDIQTQRLPDLLTAVIALLSLGLAALKSGGELIQGLAAAGIAFGLLQLVRWSLQRATGRPALGFGDVKLITALATWLGLATPWAVALAAAGGLAAMAVFRPSHGRLPFGPAIAAAAWCVGLARDAHIGSAGL